MTNKIIDGINVSGCIHYSGHLQEYIGTNKCQVFSKCEKEKNCYYKQLQRAKKEIEDLKFYIDSYNVTWEINKYEILEKIKKITDEVLNGRNIK